MVLGMLDRLEEPMLSDDHTGQTVGESSLKFHHDEDDEEEVINWRKKNKHNKIFDDDDDDEEEVPIQDQNYEKSEIKENLNQTEITESKGKSNEKHNKIFDNKDEEVYQHNYEKSEIKENVNPIEIVESKGKNVKSSFSSFLANTDLFDAEDDSDEERKVEDFSEESPMTEEREEENIFHDEFKSSKKSKHQKSKKVPSRQQIKKEDVQQIHSETQRLIRESGVHLPYHKPKTMTLQEFLNRKKRVSEELKGVKGTLARIPPIHKKCQSNVLLTNGSIDVISDSQTKNNEMKKNLPLLDIELLGEKTSNVNKSQTNSDLFPQDSEAQTTSEDLSDIHTPVLSQSDSVSQNLMEFDMTSPVIAQPVKSGLTPKLAALNLKLEATKNFTPKLSGYPDSIIELGENTPKTVQPGVKELIQRFMKHTKKITPHGKRDVNISVVHKEKDETGKVELKEHNVNISIGKNVEDDALMSTPGARFQNLKSQLRMEMNHKRREEYKKRLEAHELDNEDGFNDEEEEEEEELTETENETDDEEEEDVILKDKPKRKKLEFVDEEAEEDDEDDNEGDVNEDDEGDDNEDEAQIDNIEKKNGNENNADLKLILASDSEESFIELGSSSKIYNSVSSTIESIPTVELFEAFSQASKSSEKKLPESGIIKNCGSLSLDSSFELIGSEIPAHQPGGGLRFGRHSVNSQASQSDSEGPDFLSPDSKFIHINSRKKFPDWDDGQSLSSHLRSNIQGQSQDFNFTLRGTESAASSNGLKSHLETDEDNMSEILGLCSGTFSEDGSSPFVNNNNQQNTQDNMNDLLNLCSGKFPDGASTFVNNNTQQNTQDNMNDLLQLCSGKFSDDVSTFVNKKNQQNTQDNMNDLLQLCSGKFSDGASTFVNKNTQQNSQDNMNDLLQLCSGKFSDRSILLLNNTEQNTQENKNDLLQLSSANFSEKSESVPFLFNETNSQSNENELLVLMSGKFPSGKKKSKPIPIDSDSNDSFQILESSKLKRKDNLENCDIDDDYDDNQTFTDNENDDKESDQEDDDNMESGQELHEEEAEFLGSLAPNKKKKICKDFFEDEAELSGSENDVSSDENDDEVDGEDAELLRLDMENDEELPSEDELRNQVGRVHLKTMIDEDKRNLRLYQEMFLRDGDLWSDGQGRQRRFHWKNVDDDSQLDLFQGNQSDECNEEDDPTDVAQWRRQRHEREVWLQNKKPVLSDDEKDEIQNQGQKIDHNQVNGEKSSFDKLASIEIKKGPWNGTSISNTPRCIGSFLKRSCETLTEIAEMTKTVSNPNGPTHSRNFVFSTVSVDQKKKPAKESPSNSSNLIEISSNRNKRMRMESKSLSSIFNFL